MTEENKKTNEYVNDREVTISSFEFEESRDPPRLVINTDLGRITCKPKKPIKEMIKGMEVTKQVPMETIEVAETISRFTKIIGEKNFVKVKASYVVMFAEKDGKEVKYRYLNSIKQLEKWEVVASSPVPVEKIGPDSIVTFNDLKVRQNELFQNYQEGKITATEYTEQIRDLK